MRRQDHCPIVLGMHELTVREARRLAVMAQLLDAPRPRDPLDVVRHLTTLQIDLTRRVAPSPDLVLWSRLGRAYRPSDLDALLDSGRVVELQGHYRPVEDIALYRAEMAQWPQRAHEVQWVAANDACRRDILEVLRSDGPLPATALPDTCVQDWRSSGWTNTKNVQRMLDFMEARGEVAVVSREGGARQWDLAERVWPDEEIMPAEQAETERDRRRLVSLGIARPAGPECPAESIDVGDAGEEATIEGVRGTWRVDPDLLGRLRSDGFRGRVALLSPIDRLIFDRRRMVEIFGFDYRLEMYIPAAKRRWGYYALPILDGDRLVGKVDSTADHAAGLLRVHAVHQDEPFGAGRRAAVEREIRSLAGMLGLSVEGIPGRPRAAKTSQVSSMRS